MTVTSLHSESATSRGDLNLLEDASADLDRARVIANAAERAVDGIRRWFEMMGRTPEQLFGELDDLDVLISEAAAKAALAKRAVDDFTKAEATHRHAA